MKRRTTVCSSKLYHVLEACLTSVRHPLVPPSNINCCLVKCSDMSNTVPDEKVVVCFLAHLSKRLLEIGRETTASVSIQRCWRGYYNRVVLKRKTEAAVTLQRYMRGYLARRFLEATKYEYLSSFLSAFSYSIFRATIVLQAAIRKHQQRNQFRIVCGAALCIQVCSYLQLDNQFRLHNVDRIPQTGSAR